MSAPPPIVELRAVSKRYGAGPLVLSGLELTAPAGDFVAVIGPSGCGKTTLLRLISGLTAATTGTVTVGGRDPATARDRLGYIFQDATLLPWLTVAGNIKAPLRIKGVPAPERRRVCAAMLERVRLQDVAHRLPWQLSGGMRMRVSVARALALAPELLLLDEPFGALDEMTRQHLNEELLELRAFQAWTAFFVTHSVSEAVFLSNRILVMAAKPGRIVAEVPVPFAYPRQAGLRGQSGFLELVGRVSQTLRAVEEGGEA
jgi:NitT/TauT family transport system ATP-binding protein